MHGVKVEFHDYYGVLGVPRDASVEAIRSAYRKLARKQHPDIDKSAGSTERFQRINEAYEVLKDPEKRARYDRLGSRWKEGDPFEAPMGHPGGFHGREQSFEGFDGFSSFFESLFGEAPPDFGRARRGRGRRTRGVELEVELSLEEVLNGASRSIERRVRGGGRTARRVQIPPGVADGQLLELPGDEHGDVVRLVVRVAPHPRFRVDGFDLDADLPVTPWEAALGARVTLRGLDGSELALNLPAGGESRRLRLRGQGLPRPDGTRGDLHVQARIVVPSSLSPEERRAFEELARVSRFRPRG
ncbi:MAG: DnaJ domain-containing protein [Planctomycetes bacterium]|nr:DnaJ domain-containing protein [Planctomycetota bacterium]